MDPHFFSSFHGLPHAVNFPIGALTQLCKGSGSFLFPQEMLALRGLLWGTVRVRVWVWPRERVKRKVRNGDGSGMGAASRWVGPPPPPPPLRRCIPNPCDCRSEGPCPGGPRAAAAASPRRPPSAGPPALGTTPPPHVPFYVLTLNRLEDEAYVGTHKESQNADGTYELSGDGSRL